MSEQRPSEERVGDERLLEIAGNMQVCVPFEFGPLDLQDIRSAVLELYRLRTRPRATPLLDASLKRLAENDEEIMRLRAVAQAAKALASACEDRGYRCEVPEHRLVALESALEAAGYGMTDEELARAVDETKPIRTESANVSDMGTTVGPQPCTCRDGARYRFIRQGEDRLDTLEEEILAAVWNDIGFKGCWRERMDKRIDDAMQQLKQP